jgi:hypothetical protein
MKAYRGLPRYRSSRWLPVMAPNADFEFTEGHIRILLWMCESHQDWIDEASAQLMQNGEMPSDNLMRCREGLADLKCWGLRLLEVIEATPFDDEDEEEEYDDESDDDDLQELAGFINDLEAQWRNDRSARGRSVHPVQKLCGWVMSVFRRPMAG